MIEIDRSEIFPSWTNLSTAILFGAPNRTNFYNEIDDKYKDKKKYML